MTDAQSVIVDHEKVVGADWSGQVLTKFCSIGSVLTDCRFDRMRIQHAALGSGAEQSEYVRCSFRGTSLRALGGFTRFVNCTFHSVRVTRVMPDYLEFVDCTFTGRLTGMQFWGAPLGAPARYMSHTTFLARQGRPEPPWTEELFVRDRNDVRGNDFSGATLVNVAFRFGVDLTAQRLPVDDDLIYVPEAATTVPRALAVLERHPDAAAERARSHLERVLERATEDGQRQLLIRPRDYERRGEMPAHITLAAAALTEVLS